MNQETLRGRFELPRGRLPTGFPGLRPTRLDYLSTKEKRASNYWRGVLITLLFFAGIRDRQALKLPPEIPGFSFPGFSFWAAGGDLLSPVGYVTVTGSAPMAIHYTLDL